MRALAKRTIANLAGRHRSGQSSNHAEQMKTAMGARLLLAAMAAGAMAGTAQVGAAGAADGTVPSTPLFATAPLPGTAKPSAGASGASAPALPSMALDPQVPESLYHGLYVGTEIFGVSGHGIKGGVGGDVYAGYDRVLGNGVIVGLQGATGYGPALLGQPGLKGFDFGEASAKVGYAMGRFTPFVTAGLVVAKPITGPGLAGNTTDSFNELLNGSGNLLAAPRVGAGFAYALTGNTSIEFGVSLGRGLAAGVP